MEQALCKLRSDRGTVRYQNSRRQTHLLSGRDRYVHRDVLQAKRGTSVLPATGASTGYLAASSSTTSSLVPHPSKDMRRMRVNSLSEQGHVAEPSEQEVAETGPACTPECGRGCGGREHRPRVKSVRSRNHKGALRFQHSRDLSQKTRSSSICSTVSNDAITSNAPDRKGSAVPSALLSTTVFFAPVRFHRPIGARPCQGRPRQEERRTESKRNQARTARDVKEVLRRAYGGGGPVPRPMLGQ